MRWHLWLMDGIYSDSLHAPAVNWNPINGQVNLNNNDVDNSNDNLGVRLPVWGVCTQSTRYTLEPATCLTTYVAD